MIENSALSSVGFKDLSNPQTKEEHEEALNSMATVSFTDDLVALLRARAPLIYLTASEEKRLIRYFKHLAAARGYNAYVWDCYLGLRDLFTGEPAGGVSSDLKNEDEILNHIVEQAQKDAKDVKGLKAKGINGNFYLLLDYHRFINPDQCLPSTERRLKHLTHLETPTSVIITAPDFTVTPALKESFSLLDFPYPSREEIRQTLWKLIRSQSSKLPNISSQAKEMEEAIINATKGMSLFEVALALSKSLVLHKEFNISTIIKEKEQIIKKKGGGAVEFFVPKVSFKDVGGLGNLVSYLADRKTEFTPQADKFGVKRPKGILLLGPPGVGKSWIAKSVAYEFGVPLLAVDIGALYGSLVGESERQVREMLKLAEAMSPCVLWWDEIEKMISKGGGELDGGTSSRIFKTILTWMQEREQPVYIVATANDYEGIPPEFMRAGRFDEVWFVGLPSEKERSQIASVVIRLNGRNPELYDLKKIAEKTDGYSGAELQKGMESAVKLAFKEGEREVTTDDIIRMMGQFKPLSLMRKDQIDNMITWAKENCKMANEDSSKVIEGISAETDFNHMDL